MAKSAWPPMEKRSILGTRVSRLDGPAKVTGSAKYAYDMNRPGMLFARLLWSPHASAKIQTIDVSGALQTKGVVSAAAEMKEGDEVKYCGQTVASVLAESEEAAREAIGNIRVTYEVLPHQVEDTKLEFAGDREQRDEKPDGPSVDAAIQSAEVKIEGQYGLTAITHCCMEAHGQTCEYKDGALYVWPSTQNVSQFAAGLADAAGVPASQIHVDCQYMGGGFGSKFDSDQWGKIAVRLSKESGRPVKLMLERDQELMAAGSRPSAYAAVKAGASKDGKITAWDSLVWGSGGMGSWRVDLPYVFSKIPATRRVAKAIRTNRGSARAWRAPGHPQACLITMAALDDLATALNMDALEFFMLNADLTGQPEVYREELRIAADMIGYKEKAHIRGDSSSGPLKRGLGISIHTWGGRGHESQCEVVINPDGSVSVSLGTQDLGVGTRTAVGIVAAETLGLPLSKVQVNIGRNSYPKSNASGGSTTIGGVSTSTRDAATNALNALFEKVAPVMGVSVDQLEAAGGKVQVAGDASKSMPWEKACSLLGQLSITGKGSKPTSDGTKLDDEGVGGVQIADVTVDVETGVVTINEIVAVQDCGLIVDLKTAESQVYGALIMGVTYALYEEMVYDRATGRLLNPDMEFYRLAGLGDIGALKVHMMQTEAHYSRGVIGLGEPPVISPGAAISNAVANAIGVRVPTLPLTPDRVLAALAQGGAIA